MSKKRIGFNVPSTVGNELNYMKNAIVEKHISGSELSFIKDLI